MLQPPKRAALENQIALKIPPATPYQVDRATREGFLNGNNPLKKT
jgi:hypothetical protein